MSGTNNFWWKIVESSLLSLGVVRDLLVAQHKNNKLALDIVGILQSSVDQHSRMGASPFLLGRCLWVASRFAVIIPESLLNRYLQATVAALQINQEIVLRITAVRLV